MREILQLLLIFYAFEGLVLALYIFLKKRKGEKIECPVGTHCDAVVNSKYSTFLGIPIELLGVLYYGSMLILYSLFLFTPLRSNPYISFLMFITTFIAVAFSVYLTSVQVFILKQYCFWCLVSAALSVIILLTFIGVSEYGLLALLAANKPILILFHLLGTVIGFGSAIVSDILFFRFLKDFKISEFESDVLHIMHKIVWVGIVILVFTGIGLYLPAAATLITSATFIVKMIAVAVIIGNGLLLNFIASPQLTAISFERGQKNVAKVLELRRVAFALGSVSMVSWNTAFLIGFLNIVRNKVNISFLPLFLAYLLFLLIGILVSQILERSLDKFSALAGEKAKKGITIGRRIPLTK